jgi:peptidoglycan/LPS O-acetylase OafA/YrhL
MEENSPYHASRALPGKPSDSWVIQIPSEITSPIRHMWLLLATMATVALISGVVLLFTNKAYGTFMALALGFAGGMYLLLALGVYKRIRMVAGGVVGICVISLVGALLRLAQGDVSLVAIGVSIVSTFISIRGTNAIFAFHRFVADARRRPPGPRLSDDPAFAPRSDVGH